MTGSAIVERMLERRGLAVVLDDSCTCRLCNLEDPPVRRRERPASRIEYCPRLS
jgi:hypothetical protein